MRQKLLLFFIILNFANIYTFAQSQQKTAYEKRVEQIEKEAAQRLGYSQMNDIVSLLILDGLTDALSGRNTKKARVAMWFSEELEKAEKLKTSEDIRREKQKAEVEAEKRRKIHNTYERPSALQAI